MLRAVEMDISMDGKGREIDNIIAERLRSSVKYEEIYLKKSENLGGPDNGAKAVFRLLQ